MTDGGGGGDQMSTVMSLTRSLWEISLSPDKFRHQAKVVVFFFFTYSREHYVVFCITAAMIKITGN